MSAGRDELRGAGLRFFGAISASVTHELKNSLAIVRELSGLLSDLAAAAERGRPLAVDRVADLAARIGTQVGRADEVVKRMNRFAHQVDRSRVRLDLREALATIVGLSRRFADMRRVVIDLVLPDEPASVETDPFVLLHAVYLPLRGALEGAAEGERLVVRLRGRTISIRGSRPGPAEGTEELQEMLLSMLEAAAEPAEAGRYAFALPAAMSPEEEDDE